MRISSNTMSDVMIRQIQQLTTEQARLQTQVSTGRRITQPEDDPTAVGRVLTLQSEKRQIGQYAGNAIRALTVAQTTFSSLQGLKKVSDRAGELATLGTGAMSPDAMSAYSTEVDQMLEQALQLANTRAGSDYIFAGTAVDSPAFTATRDVDGKITAITYAGNADKAVIPLSEATSVSPQTTAATNNGIGDFLTHLVALRDALTASDIDAVRGVQQNLTDDEDLLIGAMADNGGIQTRIEAAQVQQQDRATSIEKLISNETSVDLPTTIVRLNQTNTAYQAALASAAKIMNLSLLDYIR